MKAASIDITKAEAVFADGQPKRPKDVAIACNVPVPVAVWAIKRLEKIGKVERLWPRERISYPDFGEYQSCK